MNLPNFLFTFLGSHLDLSTVSKSDQLFCVRSIVLFFEYGILMVNFIVVTYEETNIFNFSLLPESRINLYLSTISTYWQKNLKYKTVQIKPFFLENSGNAFDEPMVECPWYC